METIDIKCEGSGVAPLSSLKPFQGNLKNLSESAYVKLRGLIQSMGFSFPIFVWNDIENHQTYILDGHQRVRCLQKMASEGFDIPDLPVAQVNAANYRDAKKKLMAAASQFGDIDKQGLYEFMSENDWEMGFLEENFKLPEVDLDDFRADFFDEPPLPDSEDDDKIPEVDDTNIEVKLGDIWQLGNHRLMCGDSTNKKQVEKLMDGDKADMILADPPYDFETKGGGAYKNDKKMKQIKDLGIDKFSVKDLMEFKSLADTHVYFCNRPLIKSYIELSEDWKVSWDLAIAHKPFAPANWASHLKTDLEYIIILGKQKPNKGLDASYYSKLFSGSKDKEEDSDTGWAKPVALCEKFIKVFSKDKVLDLFLGSGSTLIACEKTNRKCYGMEIDPHYCQVIIDRWEQYTESQATLIHRD